MRSLVLRLSTRFRNPSFHEIILETTDQQASYPDAHGLRKLARRARQCPYQPPLIAAVEGLGASKRRLSL